MWLIGKSYKIILHLEFVLIKMTWIFICWSRIKKFSVHVHISFYYQEHKQYCRIQFFSSYSSIFVQPSQAMISVFARDILLVWQYAALYIM